MIFPRTRGTLLRFEDDIALAMPHVTRITSLPRSNTACTDTFAKPVLDNVAAVCQLLRAYAGVGARAWHTNETRAILVVRATDVSAGGRDLCQVYTRRRQFDPPVFQVVACVCWFPHGPKQSSNLFESPPIAMDAATRQPCTDWAAAQRLSPVWYHALIGLSGVWRSIPTKPLPKLHGCTSRCFQRIAGTLLLTQVTGAGSVA